MSEMIDRLVRDSIRNLNPYSSARSEFGGTAEIFLDANENALGSPVERSLSRYPDPTQRAVREQVARVNGVRPSQVFVGNGSDEAIDLLVRVFCQPRSDAVIVCPPTYGMYEVAAAINDVAVKRVVLNEKFDLDVSAILDETDVTSKLIFLCSPNNPTGNLLDRRAVLELIRNFPGIVVVDEAYIDFASEDSFVSSIDDFDNLVVLRTFSKAWGLAGLRVGLAFACESIVEYLTRVKPPYNVSEISQELVLEALERQFWVDAAVRTIVRQREILACELAKFASVIKVYPSEANFLLIKVSDPTGLYRFLIERRIVVRDRSSLVRCSGCLRITVGTEPENRELLEAMELYEESLVC